MIGIDTNVLVRYITQDDAVQSALASEFLERICQPNEQGFVSFVVLTELFWVLQRAYKYDKQQLLLVLATLMATEYLVVEESDLAWRAYLAYRQGTADFADYLLGHIHQAHGCTYTITLDQRAAQNMHFQLLGAEEIG